VTITSWTSWRDAIAADQLIEKLFAAHHVTLANGRYGSKADISVYPHHFRSTLESGHPKKTDAY
jgi:hypothetical protein